MELSLLKRLVENRPFTPFALVLPSDREVPIPHPEFISISPTGITAVVWYRDGGAEHVDVRLVVGAKTTGEKKRGSRT